MIRNALLSRLDLPAGTIEGTKLAARRLRELEGVFADPAAYARAISRGNPLVYTVSTVEPLPGEGALNYALGTLFPGQIGREYFMTKGHYHAWREAAEVYVGLSGEGVMLLQDEKGQSRLLPLRANTIVYVPGHTAHRTINTGTTALSYLGVYPAAAGHDYDALARENFQNVVIEQNGFPAMVLRSAFVS